MIEIKRYRCGKCQEVFSDVEECSFHEEKCGTISAEKIAKAREIANEIERIIKQAKSEDINIKHLSVYLAINAAEVKDGDIILSPF